MIRARIEGGLVGWKTPDGFLPKRKRGEGGIITKSSGCTYIIVLSVEVAYLSFQTIPIFFLSFVARDGGETVECTRGQGSACLGS